MILHRLALFPYVQLAVVSLFLLVALVALLSTKKAEQNRVWVGLTKETAHQLGTPISSLMAWIEVLKETYPNDDFTRRYADGCASFRAHHKKDFPKIWVVSLRL